MVGGGRPLLRDEPKDDHRSLPFSLPKGVSKTQNGRFP